MLSHHSRITDLVIEVILRLARQRVEEHLSLLRLGGCIVPQLKHGSVVLYLMDWWLWLGLGLWPWNWLCGLGGPHLNKWRVWDVELSFRRNHGLVFFDMIVCALLRS